jgi:hypothetical protein
MFVLIGKSISTDSNTLHSWNVAVSRSRHALEIRKKTIKDLISSYNPFYGVSDSSQYIYAKLKWNDKIDIKRILSETGLDKNCFIDSPYGLSYDIEEIEYLRD